MANTKISALTSATTPLAGTEVLPIVQSSATVKVSAANLTAGRDVTLKTVTATAAATQDGVALAGRAGGTSSYIATITPTTLSASRTVTLPNANTSIPVATQTLTFSGPTAARTITLPDANFTAARTDAAQSFTGDQTLSTGNLIIGTSGKGIDFSATPGTGTSELFADYEEGTWTATIAGTSTAGTASYTSQTGSYTKIGNIVAITLYIDWNTGTGTGNLRIAGLPYTSVASRYQSMTIGQLENVTKTVSTTVAAQVNPSTTAINFIEIPSLGGANGGLAYDAAGNIFISGTYFV